MNYSISKIMLIATSLLVFATTSCMKHETEHVMPMLNIDYPAAYIVNGSSNNVSVIKLSDNTVSATIDLDGATFPHHIYINPAKTKLAVAITNADLSAGHGGHSGGTSDFKVQIIDAVTGMIDKELALTKLPHNAVFNASGSELWIGQTDTIQSQILVYNTSDYSLKNTINLGKGLSETTFSSDGMMAFACNTTDGTVSLIDANSKMIHSTITVGTDPVGAWASSNGKMYVDNELSKTISEISVSGMNVTQTISLAFTPAYVAYSTHHSELWVTDATNGRVVYYSLISGVWTLKGSITTGANAHAIAFSANGEIAYITNQNANTVSVIDVINHSVSKTITVGTKPNGLTLKM